MRAIVYQKSGSAELLKLAEIEKPVPADDEVLIKVRAVALNPLDYHLLKHPFLRQIIARALKVKNTRPGRDVAGEVEAVGRNVTQFNPGDDVFGPCPGALAEYACARESAVAKKPSNISFEQAASIPIAGLTALQGFRDKARIQPGQKALINGAAGGVGTFAVQIGKVLGAEVTGVCSTRNLEMVQSLGADTVIDYTREDFTRNGRRYDVIFDLAGNHSFAEHRRSLTPNGIYLGAGILGVDASVSHLLIRKIPELVVSAFLSQKFINFVAKLNQNDLKTLAALISDGKVTPVIDRRYSLSEVPEAVSYLEEKHARGKVIIIPDQPLSTAHESL